MEKNLLLKEHLKKKLIEDPNCTLVILDTKGTIHSWNRTLQELTGYGKKEVIGKNISFLYGPDDQTSGLPEKLIELIKRYEKARYIGLRVRKDGTIFWGNIVISAIFDRERQLLGFTKFITEFKRR